MSKQDQYLQIPYKIIHQCKDNVLDALIWSYIFGWENSKSLSKVKLKQDHIAEFFGVNQKTVYASLDRLEEMGLIGKAKTLHGTVFTTRKDQINRFHNSKKRSNITPENGVSLLQKTEFHNSKKRSNHIIRSSSLDLSIKKPTPLTPQGESSSLVVVSQPQRPEPEPFEAIPSGASESNWTNRVANLRGYNPTVGHKRPKVTLSAAQMCKLASGLESHEISEIQRSLTEQQADTPGLLEEALEAFLTWKNPTNRVGAYLTKLRTLWDDGNYIPKEDRAVSGGTVMGTPENGVKDGNKYYYSWRDEWRTTIYTDEQVRSVLDVVGRQLNVHGCNIKQARQQGGDQMIGDALKSRQGRLSVTTSRS